MSKLQNRLFWCVLTMLFVFMVLPMNARAAGVIDTDRDVTFSVTYENGGVVIDNAKFDIYKVADVNAYGQTTLVSAFAGYPIETEGLDADGWNDLALTLKGYAQKDSLEPEVTCTTDAKGKWSVTLKPGLYLVVGTRRTVGENTYSAAPFMAFLPGLNETENTWNYAVEALPKSTGESNPADDPDDKRITRKVLKVWEDEGNKDQRPQKVVVQLMCDGKEYDTVTLDASNNWRWAWDNLEYDHDWLVVEEETEKYTTVIAQNGITFTVTNTYETDSAGKPSSSTSGTKLPQTGLLWWPVVFLSALGLILILWGIISRRSRRG